jgi:hypothetical protein
MNMTAAWTLLLVTSASGVYARTLRDAGERN